MKGSETFVAIPPLVPSRNTKAPANPEAQVTCHKISSLNHKTDPMKDPWDGPLVPVSHTTLEGSLKTYA